MTVVVLRPNGTAINSGAAIVGTAPTAHEAVNDDDGDTYIWGLEKDPLDYVAFTLDDITIPAAAVVKAAAIRVRTARVGDTACVLHVMLSDGAPPPPPIGTSSPQGTFRLTSLFVNWTAHTTITLPPPWRTMWQIDEFTETSINGAQLSVMANPGTTNPHAINIYELYVDITYVEQPVVSVIAPVDPVNDTNRPAVEWSNTLDSDGGDQTYFEVRVFTDAQYLAGGFDPDTSTPFETNGDADNGEVPTSSASTWTPSTLQPDDTYRAYVRVAQTVNGSLHWSDWDYIEYDLAVVLPAVPTLTLTEDENDGRIVIDLDDNAGDATTDGFELQRSTDGGTTWEAVRLTTDTAGIITGTSATVYDYEAPNGVATMYRARARHAHTATLTAASAWATGTVTFSTRDVWLKAPERPSLNVVVQVDSYPSRQRPARRGVFQPLGRTYPIVVRDTRQSWAGTVRIRLDTDEDQAPIDALLDSGLTLLLQVPASFHEPDRYVQMGDQDRGRLADKGFVEGVIDTLAWVEVAAPTGVVDAWPAGTS